MLAKKPKIVVVVGPTASGKTALAVKIAKQFSGEVISADSRQVYKGLDIGTEKTSTEEMSGIIHHLIDVSDINDVYTAAHFKSDAGKAIEQIILNQHLPIVAGGTFFYVDTLLGKNTLPAVEPNNELREELEKLSTEELFQKLLSLDKKRTENIDKDNPRRLMRAIEIATALGSVPLSNQKMQYDALIIGIQVDKEKLRTKLRIRAEKALTKGLIEETEELLKNISKERLSEIGLEYRLVIDYLDKKINAAELIQKLEEKNWQYAKRQLTWLKRDEEIIWVNPEHTDDIYKLITNFLTHN